MMKKLIPILCVILLTSCGGEDEYHFETYGSIADSSIHCDFIYIPNTEGVEDVSSSPDHVPRDAGNNAEYAGLSRERIIARAQEWYGVSYEWCVWLIGTTHNEQYWDDRYLEYAWACEIFNCYVDWSVWDLDGIWGDYYTLDRAYDGFYAADDVTLEMIWYAMTDRDERIVEVDGMIRWDVPGYYLIYDSEIYNCQVWGQ